MVTHDARHEEVDPPLHVAMEETGKDRVGPGGSYVLVNFLFNPTIHVEMKEIGKGCVGSGVSYDTRRCPWYFLL